MTNVSTPANFISQTDVIIKLAIEKLMKLILSLLFLSLMFVQSACAVFDSQTESREVEPFSALRISGLTEVIITQGDQHKLVVKVSGIPITDVITKVKNGTLVITTQGFHRGESVLVFVNYHQLNSISTSGSAELTGTNILNTHKMMITTDGAGDIKNLAIKADTLTVSINGSGNANLDVEVKNLDIEMNGAGNLNIQGIANQQNIRSNSSRGTLSNAYLDYSK